MDNEASVELSEINERYERRKAQNREAQRKFRNKKALSQANRCSHSPTPVNRGSFSSQKHAIIDQNDHLGLASHKTAPCQIPKNSPSTRTKGDIPQLTPGLFSGSSAAINDTSSPFLPSSEADIMNFDLDTPDINHLFNANQNSMASLFPTSQPTSHASLEPWTIPNSIPPSLAHSGGQGMFINDNWLHGSSPEAGSTHHSQAAGNSGSESASVYGSDLSPWSSSPVHSMYHSAGPPRSDGTGLSTIPGSDLHDWHLPLHIAAERGHESIVKALIDGAVDINERDSSGCTALHISVKCRQESVLKILLESGADVNAIDSIGWTPIHTAAENGFAAGLKLLLEYGGNLTLKASRKS